MAAPIFCFTRRFVAASVTTFALSTLVGCSGGEFSTAPVTGKVTSSGQPVTEGTITFAPIRSGNSDIVGKPAAGVIQKDGTFTLSTYGENDGAVVGKHRVQYSPPLMSQAAGPGGGHSAAPPRSPYAGAVPVTPEVEVKSGENNIEIEIKVPRR